MRRISGRRFRTLHRCADDLAAVVAGRHTGAVVLMATHDSWCADQADAEYHLDEGRLTQVR